MAHSQRCSGRTVRRHPGILVRGLRGHPSLRINAAYDGWRFAFHLSFVFTAWAVAAGIIIHALFWALGLIPEAKAGRVQELAHVQIDYVFSLNLAAIAISAVLLWLIWRGGASGSSDSKDETEVAEMRPEVRPPSLKRFRRKCSGPA